MRAITLHRPWPYAVFFGGKCIENRSWPPPADLIGERLAIHAGKKLDPFAVDQVCRLLGVQELRDHELHTKRQAEAFGIIGVVTVCGVATTPDHAKVRGFDDRWWANHDGNIGWLLTDRRPLKRPIECSGKQGLWELSPGQERRVLAEIGGGR